MNIFELLNSAEETQHMTLKNISNHEMISMNIYTVITSVKILQNV
jgi:hypothetical protein